MNYEQCVQELLAIGEYASMDYSLDRLTEALRLLDDPQKAFSSVHIVGTNGKGSTSVMLSQVLSKRYKTGLFTSPHLVDVRERIRIDGEMISENDFCTHYEAAKDTGVRLSFFETLVAITLLHFRQQEVDYAVLEAGLGGRLDATKLAAGATVGLTHIHLDHTRILGETREEILAEKLGIAGEKAKVFVTEQNADLKKEIQKMRPDAAWTGTYQTSLLGDYQRYNAGLAAAIAKHLGCTAEEVAESFRNVTHPGRLQYVSQNLLLDCAHNADALEHLGDYLRKQHGEVTVLFGTTHEKHNGLELLPVRDAVLTQPRIRFATPVEELDGEYERILDPIEAFIRARELAGDGLLLVTGSMYLVGNILEELQQRGEL